MKKILLVLFVTISLTLSAQPTIDGLITDAQYTTVGSFTSGRDGFGSSNNLKEIRYYQDGTYMYVGISCDLTSNDNVILFLNFSGYGGRSTGTINGSSAGISAGVFSSTNGLAGAKMDFDVDFAFAFNEGNSGTNLYMDVARFGSLGYITATYEGTCNQSGTSTDIDITSTTGGTTGNSTLAYNNSGSSSNYGIELKIPISSFSGVTASQTVQFFALITSSAGFASNECIPGDPGASNLGNNADFSAISGQDFFTGVQALPVELTSFSGKVVNGKINLNWNTATEVNNYGFEVERAKAVSGSQNVQFAKVGFVEGNGNSNSPKSYSFTDANVTSGKYIYRLKQVDTDGQFEYSQEIEVSVDNLINGYVLEQNYPNPFNPSTSIKFGFQQDTRAEVKVYNVIGAEVATLFNGIADAGRIYEVTFDASGLASGTYFYKLVTPDKTDVRKMILMK